MKKTASQFLLLSALFLGFTSCSGGGAGSTSSGAVWGASLQVGINLAAVNFNDSASDASGNLFIVGATTGALENALTGTSDIVLRKYNSAGVEQWTKQWGVAAASSTGTAIFVDASGNIYVGGHTSGDLSGDGLDGTNDAYVAKLDSSGNIVWDHQYGDTSVAGTGSSFINSIAADSTGKVFVTGSFTNNFQGVNASGDPDAFVKGFNSDGNTDWQLILGWPGAASYGFGIAVWNDPVPAANKVYVVGTSDRNFESSTTEAEFTGFILSADAADGNFNDVISLEPITSGVSILRSAKVSSTGDLYVSGYSKVDLNAVAVPSTLSGSAVVMKYTSALVPTWTSFLGQSLPDLGTEFLDLVVDSNDNVFLSGTISGELIGHDSPSDGAESDILTAKYNSAGNLMWSAQYGTLTQSTSPQGTGLDSAGDPFFVGVTTGDFDGNTAVGTFNNGIVFKLSSSTGELR